MQERRFLFITCFLLALIGGPAVYSVVREPQLKPEVRSPASIHRFNAEVESTRRNAIQTKSIVLEYPCADPHRVLQVDGSLLRLRGSSCLDEKWKDISITNKANGFTASVIFLKNKNFTTDFIDLKEGDNELSIQATDEKGRVIQQALVIHRRAPAAVEEQK